MDDRRGDWENGVNRQLVSITSAQRVMDRLLQDLEVDYAAIDKLLRGDSDQETDGLIARLHGIETRVNELRAELRAIANTVKGDHAGGSGHEQRLNALEGKRDTKQRREGYFWAFVTSTVGGALVVVAMLLLNWERIEDFWKAHVQRPRAVVAPKKSRSHRKKKPIVLPEDVPMILQAPKDDSAGSHLP